MARQDLATQIAPEAAGEDVNVEPNQALKRRSFLKGIGVAGVALSAGAMLPEMLSAESARGAITKGDAAILRFLAAAEIIETDLWLQYQEFGGTQDDEVSSLPANSFRVIPPIPRMETRSTCRT